jgi:tetratricopeptide (TPR) repeat protein
MSRRTLRHVLAFLLLVVAGWFQSRAQTRGDNTYYIEGVVVDRSGIPVKHARLILGTYTLTRQGATFSNDDGKFIFERLTEGSYRLDVSASGCANYEETIYLFSTSRNLRIVLAPASSKAEVLPETGDAVVLTSSLAIPSKAREEYGKALLAEKNRQIQEARKHLDKALHLYPHYAAAHAAKGFLFLDEQKTAEAEAAFHEALRIDPNLSEALLGMGRVRNIQSRFAEAEDLLLKARSADAQVWQVNYELGRACAGLGKDAEAEDYLRTATTAAPAYAPVYYLLAQILLRLNRPLEAIPEMEAYLRIAPEGPTADKVRDLIRRIKDQNSR